MIANTVNAHGNHTRGQRSIILDSRFKVKPISPAGETTEQPYETGDFRYSYQWSTVEVQLNVTFFDGQEWPPVNTMIQNRIEDAIKEQGYWHFLCVPPEDQPVLIPMEARAV